MTPLWRIFRMIWAEERTALTRGLILSVAVLVAGVTLLGLSGWFITAAGATGLAGLGIAFDVFRPSAGVRFLALGRTAARYGERVLTHDATLRALARLRLRVLSGLARQDADAIARLRSPALLNRVTADVDALDGIAIRLVFPLLAGTLTLGLVGVILAWLVAPLVAAWVVGILLAGAGLALAIPGCSAIAPAARAEAARQALRTATMEHLRARTVLAFAGALPEHRAAVLEHDAAARWAERQLAHRDRQAGALASSAAVLAAGAALVAGGMMAMEGSLAPAAAAIAVFAALAMAEVLAPLQRGMAEIGRMRDAAARIAPMIAADAATRPVSTGAGPLSDLRLHGVTVAAPGGSQALMAPVDLHVAPGRMVALTGRSGGGKSTLLAAIAGLAPPLSGKITSGDTDLSAQPETALRADLCFLQQHSRLVSGTIRENLRLAAPNASETEMTEVLTALDLAPALELRGGLNLRLGEGGSGLSGGEARRMALARVLLRRPRILLLDEPTEGLDAATAARTLAAIRAHLPKAAILLTTHRAADLAACDECLAIKNIF